MSTGDAARTKRVREIFMALPEVTENESRGVPTWWVRDKKSFGSLHDHKRSGDHLAIWCAAPAGSQEALIASDPSVFFRPPYVGPRGWVGVRIDLDLPWEEVAGIVEDAYRCVAPKTLIARLDT
jgi:hypothetical protein